MGAHSKLQTPAFSWISGFEILHSGVIKSKCHDIEDITWPCGDTNSIFECCQYLSRVSEANGCEILSAREDKIRIPKQPCNVLFIL